MKKIGMIFCLFLLMSCSKNNDSANTDKIMGVWISTDKSDTLDFIDNANFYNSNAYMKHDHYDYQLDNDSIKVGYRGINYILITPTKHKYNLNGNNLSIDFSNKGCYGFGLNVMNYKKKQ